MNEVTLLGHLLVLGALLFGLGLAGFLARRNMIVMFLCLELMLQGISLILVAWGRFHDRWDGQLLVIFMIAVAACEAAIALVLVLMLCRYCGSLDIAAWQAMRDEGVSPYVDREVPDEPEDGTRHVWPVLTPAGVLPDPDPQRDLNRPHV